MEISYIYSPMTEYSAAKYFHSAKNLSETTRQSYIENGFIFGIAPYLAGGIHGQHRLSDSHLEAIKAVVHSPYIWGGGYSPLVDTIHGEPVFESSGSGGGVTYDAENRVLPLARVGENNAIFVDSTALVPSKVGMLFTAKMSKGVFGNIIVGLAVDKPDLTKGFSGITKGISISIDFRNESYLRLIIKAGNGTKFDFDSLTEWQAFSNATRASNRLDIDYSLLRDGDSHTFRFENNCGVLAVMVDGVKFGTFTYPDSGYPFRLHLTGNTPHNGLQKGHMVNPSGFHYGIQANSPATSEGIQFSLHDLTFYQLHPESVSHYLSRPAEDLVPQLSALSGDNRLPASAIKDLPGSFSVPGRVDDSGETYVYFGWSSVGDSWLIKKQNRETGETLSGINSADDFETDWGNRRTILYA